MSWVFKQCKIQNVEIDIIASSGGQGKYVKYVGFYLPPLESALHIFNFNFFC